MNKKIKEKDKDHNQDRVQVKVSKMVRLSKHQKCKYKNQQSQVKEKKLTRILNKSYYDNFKCNDT